MQRKRYFLMILAALTIVAMLLMTGCSSDGTNDNTIDNNTTDNTVQPEPGDVDMEVFENIKGDYSVVWDDELEEQNGGSYEGYWAMYIGEDVFLEEFKQDTGQLEDDREQIQYFSCFDAEAGNPGFEGRIIKLSEDSITIALDDNYYEAMPFDWEPEGGLVTLEISMNGNELTLSSKGKSLTFMKYGD